MPSVKFDSCPSGVVCRVALQEDCRAAVRRQFTLKPLFCNEDWNAGVFKYEGQTLRRILRIHRQVDATGFQHSQQCNRCIYRTRQADSNKGIPLRSHAMQSMRQLVCPMVEFGVSESDIPALHGRSIRRTPHLLFEQLTDSNDRREWSRLRDSTRSTTGAARHR